MKTVLLVHGMGDTPVRMFSLGGPIRRAGFRTCYFGYSPTFQSMPSIVSRLARRLNKLQPDVVIGHSLGGLLLRMALAKCPEVKVDHLFMLGTPNQSPRLARFMWRWLPFRWFTQSCGRFLSTVEEYQRLPKPHYEYTNIAGIKPWIFSRFLLKSEPNDGVVTVEETKIDAGESPICVPSWHASLMSCKKLQAEILSRLGNPGKV